MQCFSPVTAWRTVDGEIVFSERGDIQSEIQIRCGRCVGCRLNNVNAWVVRCVHEASLYEHNAFITLTYDDEHLPQYGSLCYRDFQLFAKRLRKRLGPFRFYMCGEYGSELSRPHYHALLFGANFADRVQSNSVYSRFPIYRSELLESCWKLGLSSIGEVNSTTAMYVAKYAMKRVTGDKALDHYARIIPETGEVIQLEPEFARMSLRPGIGARWFERYGSDVWNWDNVVINGKVMPVPKYYDKLISRHQPRVFTDLEFSRQQSCLASAEKVGPSLESKAKVAEARLKFFDKRGYENDL